MHTRRSAPIAGLMAAGSLAGLVALGAPTAHAANGVFVYTGTSGQESIPFPDEDKCYATPGGTAAMNYSAGDAYLYTDAKCTIGKDAGQVKPFANSAVEFEGVKLRTAGT
ncbi:MAG: hypothetical protein ACT4QF_16145 [Sporichthyaceae bacterium]